MPASEIVENVNSDYKIIVQKRNVKVLTNDKNYEFKLFDLSGKLVENKNLKNGVYFYVLKIKGKTYKGKILINWQKKEILEMEFKLQAMKNSLLKWIIGLIY